MSKIADTLFAVITVLLIIVIITLLAKLNKSENKIDQLSKELSDNKILVLEQREELAKKTVEIVNIPSIIYEEKKNDEKPKIEYINKEITRLINVPVYSNVCLDDSGVSLINSLIDRTYYPDYPTTTGEHSQ